MAPGRPLATPCYGKAPGGDLSLWPPETEAEEAVAVPLALEKWVAPADEIEGEWKVVAGAIRREELERLSALRELVEAAGFDTHAACSGPGAAPHSRRAGTLLRFLRARGGDCEAAQALFSEAMAWRRDFGVDAKLRAWRTEWDAGTSARVRFLKQYDYIGYLGKDREGLPVYIHRHSQGDLGGLVRELGDEPLLLHMVRIIEDHLNEAQAYMMRTGKFLCSFVEIHDVGNYGLVPNWLPRGFAAAPFFKSHSPVFDKVYPERVRVCFLCRAPTAFSVIWRLASPLVPEVTKGKIRLKGYSASSWLKEMDDLLPPETIPIWLRDDNPKLLKEAKPWGGLVPRGAFAAFAGQGAPAQEKGGST